MCFFKNRKRAAKEEQPQKPLPTISYFTSEAVGPGHPDIVADAIADGLKDYILKNDNKARVAIEVLVTTQYVLLAGEVTTSIEKLPYISLVKEILKRIGYTKPDKGFDVKNVRIYSRIHSQSPDIAQGTSDEVNGAGDQGIIFGYACDETDTLIPLSWKMARDITTRCHKMSKKFPDILCPDCKSQVTVKYEDDNIVGIDTIVVAASHEDRPQQEIEDFIIREVLVPVLDDYGFFVSDVKHIYINGTGRFVKYGPDSDSGVTGRKLIVAQYGGHSAIGGGSMQGKDSTKVDLSAALMARYIAKNIVAAGLATKCQVQLAYCIGKSKPVSININCFGTNRIPTEKLENYISQNVDCSPLGIINRFNLRFQDGVTFYYEDCSARGWFGRDDVDLPWEANDLHLNVVDWNFV